MRRSINTVLAVAPHTDDAELGAGGTIARFIEDGTSVFVVAFSTAEDSLPNDVAKDLLKTEFLEAMPKLGVSTANLFVHGYPVRRLSSYRQEVLDELVQLRRQVQPDFVLLPSSYDIHQDHQVLHAEGMRAFKDVTVFGYELPWNQSTFSAQAFVALERRHIEAKWRALQAYKSQIDVGRPYFAREFIEALAHVRGVQIKHDYAEAFEVIRVRI